MTRRLLEIGMLTVAAINTGAMAADAAQTAPLIERAKLFGNPDRVAGRLSPDGKWLAWIAPRDGVLNVWVAPRTDPAKERPLTAEKTRPIREYFWAPDSSSVLFINDRGGDENFQLYSVGVDSGAQRSLTPFDKTRVTFVGDSKSIRDRLLIGVNRRDPRWHDVYSLDLASGELTEVYRNTGEISSFVADDDLELRLARKTRADGGADFHTMSGGKVEDAPFASVGLEDVQTTGPHGYTQDGTTLYWIDSRGRDTAALVAQDAGSGTLTVIAQSPKSDIVNVLVDPATGRVQAYEVNYLKSEWVAVDAALKDDLAFLQAKLGGNFGVTSRTDADDYWTVVVDPVSAPATTYLYARFAKTLDKLFVNRPQLEGVALAAMHPVEIRTRDGLTQTGYLTLPPGTDPKGDGRPARPLSMVLLVHGGPWARDTYGYSANHQWLANRGYAVLSVNFRGSTGFGKKFISAGDLQWGAKMHDDLLDAVEWAVTNRIATRDKVAIMGGSYGGYATLAGLAFTPDVFACGVDIVGPSDIATLLAAIPPYWEAVRTQFYRRMGDPTTEAGRKLLRERSPLYKADAIRRPLLIAQGANDPRVKQAESDQIVAAMNAKKIPVTYVLFPDEGHGFARPENNIAFAAVTEVFLAKCLGGRAEPIGDVLRASSLKVPQGAQNLPALQQALGTR